MQSKKRSENIPTSGFGCTSAGRNIILTCIPNTKPEENDAIREKGVATHCNLRGQMNVVDFLAG
jgi:hypothetical protein